MLTCRPIRFPASTRAHPANATPWPKSAPHNLKLACSRPMRTAGATLNGPAQVAVIPFRAQSAALAQPKQLSIPILLPR